MNGLDHSLVGVLASPGYGACRFGMTHACADAASSTPSFGNIPLPKDCLNFLPGFFALLIGGLFRWVSDWAKQDMISSTTTRARA